MGNAQPQADTAKFTTTRFGEIDYIPSEVLYFPEGLLGFNPLTHYVLLSDPEQDPFLWMQSIQDADLAFVVVDPFLFFPGYEIQVKPHELAGIELDDVAKASVLSILTVPDNPMDLTANLRGPLVINSERKLAKQLVLIDDRYHTRHLLLRDIPDHLAQPLAPQAAQNNVTSAERDSTPPRNAPAETPRTEPRPRPRRDPRRRPRP